MPGLSGLALTTQETIEIISLYASSSAQVPAVVSEPGWVRIGAFPIPTTADIRLDLLGLVSDPALTMTARLYDVTPGFVGIVSGSTVVCSSTIEAESFSGVFTVAGGHSYQVQCQVVGAAGAQYFGTISRVAPAGI